MVVPCSSCSQMNRVPPSKLHLKAKCSACKAPLLPLTAPVPMASDADFDALVKESSLPVLVDFWAAWCGPCRAVAPELAKVAASKAGNVVVAKVDTEALPNVAGRYGIRSIPTFMLFKNGQEAKRFSGAMPAEAIVAQSSL